MTRRAAPLAPDTDDPPAPVIDSFADALKSLAGSADVVDLGYPRVNAFGGNGPLAYAMLRRPRPDIEAEFLLRFRQAGGHQPISAIDVAELVAQREPAILGFEDFDAAAAASAPLGEAGYALLIPDRCASGMPVEDRGLDSYRSYRLNDQDGSLAFRLFVPRSIQPPSDGDDSKPLVFRSGGRSFVIEACHMIHDGGYSSEGDERYSWLWTGPSTHFRLIAPQLAGNRPRLVELGIPRTEDNSNLDRLAVQIDGRPVQHRLERWSDNSGRVGIDIPASQDYAAITLIVPKPTHDAQSGRLLGLCLDKLILTP
jgi:hypothetical protein